MGSSKTWGEPFIRIKEIRGEKGTQRTSGKIEPISVAQRLGEFNRRRWLRYWWRPDLGWNKELQSRAFL